MDVVKLGPKGQVSIPKSVLQRLGMEGEQILLVDVTGDGAIVLRPAGAYPLELYDDERIQAFLDEDTLPEGLRERMAARVTDDPAR
ncbi:MAG: AbrB/MazE/SpoVT family DNA-binding domain-containing protein [Trueperaceae bacterium]|nr:AbrB/MazE/SpoVT family DNA-binding domain-containing protein [Trueperaceae bacterium]